jgi:hypothetical protein
MLVNEKQGVEMALHGLLPSLLPGALRDGTIMLLERSGARTGRGAGLAPRRRRPLNPVKFDVHEIDFFL